MNKSDGQDNATGNEAGSPIEYFCMVCFQLRLSFRLVNACCGNCGSARIIRGMVGQLDKQALLLQYKPKEE